MKKIICAAAALLIAAGSAWADEGMWLLPLLKQMNAKALEEAGCRLTPDQIYSINHSSLKDAIVQFGGGCTGEVVSDNGLLLTNHHCGYASIQKLSSVEHDYLADGYWAMRMSEELPVDGLSVTFLESMTDITNVIEKAEKKFRKELKDAPNSEELVQQALAQLFQDLVEAVEKDQPECHAEVESFYNENVYYLIVYKTYTDIRFVGAPPSSIGKFGADTDNWMWPRHTCDFSMFRIYADKNNNPAPYSKDNVPYTPKQSLKISLKGVQEGDYTMIMGYPGTTTRFQTSPELEQQIRTNDIRIAARTVRQDIMMDYMLADPAVKIQYASKYSSSSNGWKKWQGMKLAFDKLGIIERTEQQEAEFSAWAAAKPKRQEAYGSAIPALKKGILDARVNHEAFTLAYESLYQIELVQMATIAKSGRLDRLEPLYKDYCAALDRDEAKALVAFYKAHSLPEYAFDCDIDIDEMFDKTVITSWEKLSAADSTTIANDPAVAFANAAMEIVYGTYYIDRAPNPEFDAAQKAYTAGLLEWRKGQPSYPDANFTMRLTYGHVMPYSPKDAVLYRHYTTLDGVMEKEDPDNWEFVVPAKLKELWKAKDYGQYAMPNGQMPACFLSNNDITGGNSGSPVMNADGELLGLAFDGNWESMSSDVMFEPDLQRCINVDIRYVLFIIDKFGGAGWLIDEMNLVK
ncbi:MAG: S46 family peptidase [Bacteroidales bacterium]|nr:S46 family peptidase [Bacteroidales bacterium]